MAEGFINLFVNNPEGDKPHMRGYFKLDGMEHEFALWPAKNGKKGYSGKFKPKDKTISEETQADIQRLEETARPTPKATITDEIPF